MNLLTRLLPDSRSMLLELIEKQQEYRVIKMIQGVFKRIIIDLRENPEITYFHVKPILTKTQYEARKRRKIERARGKIAQLEKQIVEDEMDSGPDTPIDIVPEIDDEFKIDGVLIEQGKQIKALIIEKEKQEMTFHKIIEEQQLEIKKMKKDLGVKPTIVAGDERPKVDDGKTAMIIDNLKARMKILKKMAIESSEVWWHAYQYIFSAVKTMSIKEDVQFPFQLRPFNIEPLYQFDIVSDYIQIQ